MFLEAVKDHSINLGESLMIGDSVHDIKSGNNLDMDTVLVLTGRGKDTIKDNKRNLMLNYYLVQYDRKTKKWSSPRKTKDIDRALDD